MSSYPLIDEDGINHGSFTIEDCINAVIQRCEDGFVLCPILWSGGSCEECMEMLERNEK